MRELVSTSPTTLFTCRSMASPYPSNGTSQSLTHSVVYLLKRLQTPEEICLWLQQQLSTNLHRFLLLLRPSQFIRTSTNTARPSIIETSSTSITRTYSWINCPLDYLLCVSSIIGFPSRSKSHGWHRFIVSRNITRRLWKRISNSNYAPASWNLQQHFHWPLRSWSPRRTLENLVMSKIYDEGTRTRKP